MKKGNSDIAIGSRYSDLRPIIVADAHVHIHECFKLSEFLSSAWRNFHKTALQNGYGHVTGVLLLTETAGVDWFGRLSGLADHDHATDGLEVGDWRFRHTAEPCSLIARRANQELVIMAGRQIVTQENLEVLALATNLHVADGAPIRRVLETVLAGGALAVLPWGFGKWTGTRGKVVENMIQAFASPRLFLGDNSARLRLWPAPGHFRTGAERGIRILPGSDPLPFAAESGRAGSFGFSMDVAIGNGTPASDLKAVLEQRRVAIVPYGCLENPFRFLRNQIAMQWIKRQKRLRAAACL
ncbi:MAG: hypothetical protein ACREYC_05080 [Gammaproteobacteria bacterium]